MRLQERTRHMGCKALIRTAVTVARSHELVAENA